MLEWELGVQLEVDFVDTHQARLHPGVVHSDALASHDAGDKLGGSIVHRPLIGEPGSDRKVGLLGLDGAQAGRPDDGWSRRGRRGYRRLPGTRDVGATQLGIVREDGQVFVRAAGGGNGGCCSPSGPSTRAQSRM